MNWIKTHKRATSAIIGTLMVWGGVAIIATVPVTLILSGVLLFVITMLTYLPSDTQR